MQSLRKELQRTRSDVQDPPARRDFSDRHHLREGFRIEAIGDGYVHGQHQLGPGTFHQDTSHVQAPVLDQRVGDVVSFGLEEGVGHTTADEQRVHPDQQILDHADLV